MKNYLNQCSLTLNVMTFFTLMIISSSCNTEHLFSTIIPEGKVVAKVKARKIYKKNICDNISQGFLFHTVTPKDIGERKINYNKECTYQHISNNKVIFNFGAAHNLVTYLVLDTISNTGVSYYYSVVKGSENSVYRYGEPVTNSPCRVEYSFQDLVQISIFWKSTRELYGKGDYFMRYPWGDMEYTISGCNICTLNESTIDTIVAYEADYLEIIGKFKNNHKIKDELLGEFRK